MSSQPRLAAAEALGRFIAGEYEPDLAQPLPSYGGGQTAYAVRGRGGGPTTMMAFEVAADDPPRPHALAVLQAAKIASVMLPLRHGVACWPDGRAGQFVVCRIPPGRPLAESLDQDSAAWDEATLLRDVVHPAAAALASLHDAGVTHRAIRPNNVFRAATGGVTLGCAWASSPGRLQPAVLEPPYMAACVPAARGNGQRADDIYALGALLVTLLGQRLPMAGLSELEMLSRKLELGSFRALTLGLRLPAALGEVLQAMLSDEPEHRPAAAVLADAGLTRVRRPPTRPARRADRPLQLGHHEAWTARTLAYALAAEPAAGLRGLRDGLVMGWLQRSLGDPIAAVAMDAVAPRRGDLAADAEGDAFMLMRAVAVLDPAAPMCWCGISLWPDGIGPALVAATDPQHAQQLLLLVSLDPVPAWLEARGQSGQVANPMLLPRLHRVNFGTHTAASVPWRLRYALNPLLACRSPSLGGALALRAADVPPALELMAARADQRADLPLDMELVAFIAARFDRLVDPNLAHALPAIDMPGDAAAIAGAALAQLRVLARLQGIQGAPTPHLAGWLANRTESLLSHWRRRAERTALRQTLREQALAGRLTPMLALFDDQDAKERDRLAANAAELALALLDREIASLRQDTDHMRQARITGGQIAAALGVIALSGTLLSVLLG